MAKNYNQSNCSFRCSPRVFILLCGIKLYYLFLFAVLDKPAELIYSNVCTKHNKNNIYPGLHALQKLAQRTCICVYAEFIYLLKCNSVYINYNKIKMEGIHV